MSIELLESRIAPAFIVLSPTMATYTDVDGDLVTIKSSKPILDDTDFVRAPIALGDRLLTIDFSNDGPAADGTTLSIVATRSALGGDGLANVGYINATGRVLGRVTVDGDLGVIDAGDTTINPFAIQRLTVQSLGQLGSTSGAPGDLQCNLAGSVKSITVKGDVRDAFVSITGQVNSKFSSLGALTIGGSLLATNPTGLGTINVEGEIGPVRIGGSVIGGSAPSSGGIGSFNGSMGNVRIGGDVIGGPAGFTGYIFAITHMGNVKIGGDLKGGGISGGDGNAGFISAANGSMGNVKIGGSIIGGASAFCGTVSTSTGVGDTGKMGKVSVGGSVIGGAELEAGSIFAAGGLGSIKIGGDLKGGAGVNSGLVHTAAGDIGGVTIRGSLIGGGSTLAGGIAATNGSLGPIKIGGDVVGSPAFATGRIFAAMNIASVTIGGSLVGGGGSYSGTIQIGPLAAGGQKIGPITIAGSVLGGAGSFSGGIIGDGFLNESLGAVKVGGDWIGSGGSSARLFIGAVASVTIGGSIFGGADVFSSMGRPYSRLAEDRRRPRRWNRHPDRRHSL